MGRERIKTVETESLRITMTEEIWRPVVGYEGLYEVSNTGLIRSLDRFVGNRNRIKGKILSIRIEKNGYCSVALSKYGKIKRYKIHRLVAQAFIPNPEGLPEVNHLDEDKTNNSVDNLEWCDRKYNMNFGSRLNKSLLTKSEKGYIDFNMIGLDRKEYGKIWRSNHKDIMREYSKKYYMMNKDKWKIYKTRKD